MLNIILYCLIIIVLILGIISFCFSIMIDYTRRRVLQEIKKNSIKLNEY